MASLPLPARSGRSNLHLQSLRGGRDGKVASDCNTKRLDWRHCFIRLAMGPLGPDR